MAAVKSIPADEELMAQLWIRFKADDEKAFDQLVQARYRTLYNYATRFTKDYDLIKDCIQDLFLELWNRRKNIVETPYVTIYLIKSIRNNLLRKLRTDHLWRNTIELDLNLETFITDGWTPERECIQQEEEALTEADLRHSLDLLPKRQQEAIFLKFYQSLSNEDIAQVMEVEKQTVANFLHRAITQLRKTLPAQLFV